MYRSQVMAVMCSTVDFDIKVKNVLALRQTGVKNVALHATTRGIPKKPTRKSDTAKLQRIRLLVVLREEKQQMRRITPPFINRIITIMIMAGIVSKGIPDEWTKEDCGLFPESAIVVCLPFWDLYHVTVLCLMLIGWLRCLFGVQSESRSKDVYHELFVLGGFVSQAVSSVRKKKGNCYSLLKEMSYDRPRLRFRTKAIIDWTCLQSSMNRCVWFTHLHIPKKQI